MTLADIQAVSTILIGVVVAYVAWQQWKTARAKFRLDYFDRRFRVYEAAMSLAATVGSGELTLEPLEIIHQFLRRTREVVFLFDEEIELLLKEMHREALALIMGTEKLQATALSEEERQDSQALLLQRHKWFQKKLDEMPGTFRRFLKIEE